MRNLLDPLYDEENLTASGCHDPVEDVHTICEECGGINGKHSASCGDWIEELAHMTMLFPRKRALASK